MGAWVSVASSNPVRQVISHDNGGYDRSLGIDSRGDHSPPPGWSAFSDGSAVLGDFPVTLNQWTFIPAVYYQQHQSVTLYVDGQTMSESGNLGFGHNFFYELDPIPAMVSIFMGSSTKYFSMMKH